MQYGFDFGLWTRNLVRELVQREFDVTLSLASIGAMLARLNLTPQKPLQRAYQRDPEAIERWQHDTYPAIVRHTSCRVTHQASIRMSWCGVTSSAQALRDARCKKAKSWGRESTSSLLKSDKTQLSCVPSSGTHRSATFLTYGATRVAVSRASSGM